MFTQMICRISMIPLTMAHRNLPSRRRWLSLTHLLLGTTHYACWSSFRNSFFEKPVSSIIFISNPLLISSPAWTGMTVILPSKFYMTATLSDNHKPEGRKKSYDFLGWLRFQAHWAGTSTNWNPTSSIRSFRLAPSASKYAWIASLILPVNSSRVLAWVWHPGSSGTEAM